MTIHTRFSAFFLRTLCTIELLLCPACDANDDDGGPCEYEAVEQYEGVVTSVERATSETDAPFLVQIEIVDAEQDDVQSTCELRIDDTEADAIEREGIAAGREVTLDLMAITDGACAPEHFEVRELDLVSVECY